MSASDTLSAALFPARATLDAIGGWLPGAVENWRGPTHFTPIAGGRSNVTVRAQDADGRRLLLRMPPPGAVLATAHDILREARIIDALRGRIPVPAVAAQCSDPAVAGAGFAVFEYVDGPVLRHAAEARAASDAVRATVGPSLVDALARLHRLPPAELGLSDLVREGDYVDRQLRRWTRQIESGGGRHRTRLADLATRLGTAVPHQRYASLVHGDPKLDNCILSEDGGVRAIVDWELAAVGDPLADVALMLAYWAEPDDEQMALQDPPQRVAGFARRTELIERYATMSGFDVDAIPSYLAFSYWKLACIVAGVVERAERHGGMTPTESAPFHAQVERLADLTTHALDAR